MKMYGVSKATLLKMVSRILKSHTPKSKGFVVNTKKGKCAIKYEELIEFVDEMAKNFECDDYIKVHRCKQCGHFSQEYCKYNRGYCMLMAEYHTANGYCCNWIPMSEQQKQIRKYAEEHNWKL